MKIYKMFSFKSDNRSYSIIPFDKNFAEDEAYHEYISEKIEHRVKEMIFGVIEFLNENAMEDDFDESK